MNSIRILKELWRRRVLVALSIFAAAAIAVLAVYEVGVSPPSISKRTQVNAQGSIEILVDSSRSPIADVGRNLTPLTARAGVFARYIAGGNVISKISKETGIPVNQIDVAGPAPLPGEVPGAEEESPQLRPYGIAIKQSESLPIVTVTTRAPTLNEARDLAAAAPRAVRQVVERIQVEQDIPADKRVEFRALGPAEAAPVADALGAKVALPLFFVLLGIFILLILGIPRFRAAWRAAEPDSLSAGPEGDAEQVSPPAVLHVPTEASGDAERPHGLGPPQDARGRSGLKP